MTYSLNKYTFLLFLIVSYTFAPFDIKQGKHHTVPFLMDSYGRRILMLEELGCDHFPWCYLKTSFLKVHSNLRVNVNRITSSQVKVNGFLPRTSVNFANPYYHEPSLFDATIHHFRLFCVHDM